MAAILEALAPRLPKAAAAVLAAVSSSSSARVTLDPAAAAFSAHASNAVHAALRANLAAAARRAAAHAAASASRGAAPCAGIPPPSPASSDPATRAPPRPSSAASTSSGGDIGFGSSSPTPPGPSSSPTSGSCFLLAVHAWDFARAAGTPSCGDSFCGPSSTTPGPGSPSSTAATSSGTDDCFMSSFQTAGASSSTAAIFILAANHWDWARAADDADNGCDTSSSATPGSATGSLLLALHESEWAHAMLGPKESAAARVIVDSAAPEILIARWNSTPMNLKEVLLPDAAAAARSDMYLYRPAGSPLLQQLTPSMMAARAERYHRSSPFAAALVMPTAAEARMIAASVVDESALEAMLCVPPPGFGTPAYHSQMPTCITAVSAHSHDLIFWSQPVDVHHVIRLMKCMVLNTEEETLFREAYNARFGPSLHHKINERLARVEMKLDATLEKHDKVLKSVDGVTEMADPAKQKTEWGTFVVFGRKFDVTKVMTVLQFFGIGQGERVYNPVREDVAPKRRAATTAGSWPINKLG